MEKELRRLSRRELLEIMVEQGRELERLKKRLAAAEEELSSRIITVERMGNLADAVMELNGVFAAAEAAGKQYVENLEAMYRKKAETEAEAARRADEILAQAKMQREQILEQARLDAEKIRKEAMDSALQQICGEYEGTKLPD